MWRTLCFAFSLLGLPSLSQGQAIRIFFDEDATCNVATVGPAPLVTLHVVANLGGLVQGLEGASFRINGAPSSWAQERVFWVVDQSVTLGLGHPIFDGEGTVLAFQACRGQDVIPLGRLILNSPPTPTNTHLFVSDGAYDQLFGPVLFLCDAPIFTAVVVDGGSVSLNPNIETPPCTLVGVQQVSWSAIKSVYGH